jgi:hypothetical protein
VPATDSCCSDQALNGRPLIFLLNYKSMEASTPKIVVLGSLNVDVFLQVKRMPVIGETLQTEGLIKGFGGKVCGGPSNNYLGRELSNRIS